MSTSPLNIANRFWRVRWAALGLAMVVALAVSDRRPATSSQEIESPQSVGHTRQPIQLCQHSSRRVQPEPELVEPAPEYYEHHHETCLPWHDLAQGEYVGHARTQHVDEYRLRVDDELEVVYRVTRDVMSTPYKLNVGDEIGIESSNGRLDAELNGTASTIRPRIVEPDGKVTMRLIGRIHASGQTVSQLQEKIDKEFRKFYRVPAITVVPLKVNTKLQDVINTIDRRQGLGGQSLVTRVTPEGTIQLPAIGSVFVQGLSLPELKRELDERYAQIVEGIAVTPILTRRAPRYVFVLGEVAQPGRYTLEGPTSLMHAIAMAGSWNVGARVNKIVILRRADDWSLMGTAVNVKPALNGNDVLPEGDIWLNDLDVVIVPKGHLLRSADFIDLLFTRGIYGIIPADIGINFAKLSSI
ncbi:MAG: polysaccharide biosynthesis/export family protein [Pirellulales bacterium]|nr:polysaccharide biosynthesis/export family protein [Pirellulales bacterium]